MTATTPPLPPPTHPAPAPPKKPSTGKSCLLFGCGGCLTVILVLLLGSFFMARSIRKSLNQPPFPAIELSEAEQQILNDKRNLLGLTDGESTPVPGDTPVILSARELNALLFAANPELEDTVRLSLEPDTIRGELRIGENDQRIAVQIALGIRNTPNGIEINLRDARVGNFGIPAFMRQELENENLAHELFDTPEEQARFEQLIQHIEIQQDAILFLRKKDGTPPPENQ